jgi:hypothetical protein
MAVASQNGRLSAKMAVGAAELPKWQPLQISCQTKKLFWHAFCTSKCCATKTLLCPNFFYLQLPIPYCITMAESNGIQEKESRKMQTMTAAPGMYFDGTRLNDDRRFTGTIAKVVYTADRTMIVVEVSPKVFKSVYLDDCRGYLLSDYAQ